MIARWEWHLLAGLSAVLIAGWSVQSCRLREIDGKTAEDWLEYAQSSARTLAYHAEGISWTNGVERTFHLDQAHGGSYVLQVDGISGADSATIGFDGTKTWFDDGKTTLQADTNSARYQQIPPESAQLIGLGSEAGLSVVRLTLASGPTRKLLAIDRTTGVILAMITSFRGADVSRMRLSRIRYGEHHFQCRPPANAVQYRAANESEAAAVMGGHLITLDWLPPGYRADGIFIGWCDCCQTHMAMRRYSDGINTFTLFQTPCLTGCAESEGCFMAPSGSALVETKTVGNATATLVGTLTPGQAQRIFAHLHR